MKELFVILCISFLIFCVFFTSEFRFLDLENYHYPVVDVVVSVPHVVMDQTNFSVLSLLRFAPWIRNFHFWNEEPEKYSGKRIFAFRDDLLTYSLLSPHLSEHFLILDSGYLIKNYIFPWQFFPDAKSWAVRPNCGLVPMTRTAFNLCTYAFDRKQPQNTMYDMVAYARTEALRMGLITSTQPWGDHFKPQTSLSNQKCSVSDLRQDLYWEEVIKKNTHDCVVVLFSGQELSFISEEYDATPQVWIRIGKPLHPDADLTLQHQMIVMKRDLVQVDPRAQNLNDVGVQIMKRLRRSHYQPIRVVADQVTHDIGQKLAQVYDCPSDPLRSSPSRASHFEHARLSFL